MAASSFPGDIKVFLNGVDITYYIFGADTYSPGPQDYIFRDIDLSSFIATDGIHEIVITTDSQTNIDEVGDTVLDVGAGEGRVDCRVEIA